MYTVTQHGLRSEECHAPALGKGCKSAKTAPNTWAVGALALGGGMMHSRHTICIPVHILDTAQYKRVAPQFYWAITEVTKQF
jgi:hypothetical protein